MNRVSSLAIGIAIVVVGGCRSAPQEMRIESLLRRELARELAPDREVILSRVEIPPHTTLPWHWHPGEEFAYVLDGEVTAHIGKEKRVLGAGGAGAIPLEAVHTASTGAAGARLLVFRIHVKGEPGRHLVEAPADAAPDPDHDRAGG